MIIRICRTPKTTIAGLASKLGFHHEQVRDDPDVLPLSQCGQLLAAVTLAKVLWVIQLFHPRQGVQSRRTVYGTDVFQAVQIGIKLGATTFVGTRSKRGFTWNLMLLAVCQRDSCAEN